MIGRKDPVVGWGKPAVASLILLSLSCEERIHDPIALKPPDSTAINRWPWEDIGLNNKYPMRMVKSGGYVYVAAGVDGVWRLDGEDMWEYLGLRDSVSLRIQGVGVLAVDVHDGELFAGLHSTLPIDSNRHVGVWRLSPNSSEWVSSDSGIRVPEWRSSAVWDVMRAPGNPQLMLAGQGSIFRSVNEGRTWELCYPNSRDVSVPFLRFAWHSADSRIVWCLSKSNRSGALINRSVDEGITWEARRTFPDTFSLGYYSMAFDAMDPNIVYLGSTGAIVRSTNGGQDWINGETMVPLFRDPLGRAFQELVTHPRRGGVFFAATDTNVYLSEDAGETVYLLPSPTNRTIFSMIYDAENNWLLVGSYQGIFRLREPLNVPRERYK